MRKIHWFLVAAVVLAWVAVFRAHVAAIPAAVALVIWISEVYPDPDSVPHAPILSSSGVRQDPRSRGRRAAQLGAIPRISSYQIAGRQRFSCKGYGRIGYGNSRTAAYDAWELQL